ncbi:MAG: hypothetical protein J6T22_11670 [Bacteroidales bacterium]|nr:hypothetical protein [Bacteroidales bacterium]
MKIRTDLLIRSMTPERAAEVLKQHGVVDSCESKHKIGAVFAKKVWPLLKRHIEHEGIVEIEEIVGVCKQELQHLQKSAIRFCEEAFRITLIENDDDGLDKPEYEKAWRFREMAIYLNEHPDNIDAKLLDWAYFTWNFEFAYALELNEDLILALIGEIDAEAIKNTRHNRDYYGYGGSYLDVPDWLAFLAMFLEENSLYDLLNKAIEKLHYLPIQDALAHRLVRAETFKELICIKQNPLNEYGEMMLEHWYKRTVQEGATLRGYRVLDINHPLAAEGNRLFEVRENNLATEVHSVMKLFCEKIGRKAVEKWFYGANHFHGLLGNDADESESEIRQIIETYLEETFKPADAMPDFANADYLVFLGNLCEKLKDDRLLSVLDEGYKNFLHTMQIYHLPKFGDDLLEIMRGFSLSLRLRKNYNAEYTNLLEYYLTRHEGWGVKVSDDYNHKVIREAFVMSALMLMTEDEDLLERDRKKIFDEVKNLLFLQINSCWMDHLQELYVEALKMAYVMVCQVWKKDRDAFEMNMVQRLDNLYWVASVISVGDGTFSDEAAKIMKARWEKERLVMYVRAQQTHRMKMYDWLKDLATGI